MKRLRVLSLAAATGRIGHVLVLGGKLLDWGLSRSASRNPERAAHHAEKLIAKLKPDVVVTENVPTHSTKSSRTRALIEAMAKVAACAKLLDVKVIRPHESKNKFVEAAQFANLFPELSAWVPKPRRLWDPEPRTTVLFDALALAAALEVS